MKLRPYQTEAIKSVINYWENGGGNPLVEMATGTGKSVCIAMLVKHLVETHDAKVIMLTHVKELVAQNFQAMLRSWPEAPIGVNSAGLGRRDKRTQILFASIQSVANENLDMIGHRDVVLIDEAHLLPPSGEGRYRSFLSGLKQINPDLRIAGFTATPYRLGTGMLYGKGSIFDDLVYAYGISDGVKDGYLCPLRSIQGSSEIDVSSIGKSQGDFIQKALQGRALDPEVLKTSCNDMVKRLKDRKSCLIFCSGVEHAKAVRDYLNHLGEKSEYVVGDMVSSTRDSIIDRFKKGSFKYLTNANVLTTGFDAPIIDSIVLMRPTLSTGLYVQMLGRGTRVHPHKSNTLVLDYSGNARRHGPVDSIEIKSRHKTDIKKFKINVDDVNSKVCPNCDSLLELGIKQCPDCNHEFKRQAPIISTSPDNHLGFLNKDIKDEWIKVDNITAHFHASKSGTPSIRVEYRCGLTSHKEWVCPQHEGYARKKAMLWWKAMTGEELPFKKFNTEIVQSCVNEWKDINLEKVQIKIMYECGFPRVICRKFKRDGQHIEVPDSLIPIIL